MDVADSTTSTTQVPKVNHDGKILELLLLRCVRLRAKDFWSASVAIGEDTFNNILFVKNTEDSCRSYIIWMNCKNDSRNAMQQEFLVDGLNSLGRLVQSADSVLSGLDSYCDINIVILTNALLDNIDFLTKDCTKIPLLNFSADCVVYKIDLNSFLKVYRTNPEDLKQQLHNIDLSNVTIHSFTEQAALDLEIVNEIQALARQLRLIDIDVSAIAENFDKYVNSSYGDLNFTKKDVVLKLCEQFLGEYEVGLRHEQCNFYSCSQKLIWNRIVHDKVFTVVDFNETVFKFLKQYIATEVRKCCNIEGYWGDTMSHTNTALFYQNNETLETRMQLVLDRNDNITALDIYKGLWLNGRIPLLLLVNTVQAYENIVRILTGLNINLKVIIINKMVLKLTTMIDVQRHFITMHDLQKQDRDVILNQEISFQGRLCTKLEHLVDKSMYALVKCKDVIEILSKNYIVGIKYEPIPKYYIERSLFKIIVNFELLKEVTDEIFIVKNEGSYSDALIELLQGTELTNIIIGEAEVDKLKCTGKVIHRLVFNIDNQLEWRESLGSIENIQKYLLNEQTNSCERLKDVLSNTATNILNNTHIISGINGMGKSTLMNSIVFQAPSDMWVLKITLGDHKEYYETLKPTQEGVTAYDHLNHFSSGILEKCKCKRLHQEVFQKLCKLNKVLVLLDGFSELSVSCKKTVTKILKCLQNENYSTWLTSSSDDQSFLENQLYTVSRKIRSFSSEDQILFLNKYFLDSSYDSHQTNQLLIKKFSEKLLQTSERNFVNGDKFMGLPANIKFLADAFGPQLKESLLEGEVKFRETYNLLHPFEEFRARDMGMLCGKYRNLAECFIVFFGKHQKLLALKALLDQSHLVELCIDKQLEDYYEDKKDVLQILKKEGFVEMERNHGQTTYAGNFALSTYAEYLVALWMVENLNSNAEEIKMTIEILCKRRFCNYSNRRWLFVLFDHIIAKNCPLHESVIDGKAYAAEIILLSDPASAGVVDMVGRTVLHLIALYGIPYLRQSGDDINKELIRIIKGLPNGIMLDVKDHLGYSAIDYAIANETLAIANAICEKLDNPSINIDITPSHFERYLDHSVRLQDYKPLFKALFKNRVCLQVLEKKFLVNDNYSYHFMFTNELANESERAYLQELGVSIVSGLLIKMKLKMVNKWHFYDLRLAAALGTVDNILILLAEGNRIDYVGSYSYTPLHCAILHNRIDNVNLLISKGANLDLVDMNGHTGLHWASVTGCNAIIQQLLLKGADVNKQNNHGDTPLHCALKYCHADTAELLLPESLYQVQLACEVTCESKPAKCFDVDAQNHDGDTPLMLAFEYNHLNVAKLLIRQHADVNIVNSNGDSCLHHAAKMGEETIVLELIYSCLDINKPNIDGKTALFLAIKERHANTAKLLLSKGANVKAVENEYGYSCLHQAAKAGFDDIVRDLVNKGAGIDKQTNIGETPLMLAVKKGHVRTIELLLRKGANVNIEDQSGCVSLHYAAKACMEEIVAILLNEGPNMDKQNNRGNSPLMWATKQSCINIVKSLLRKGARTDLLNGKGNSCLHYAARVGADDILLQFLKVQVDVNIRNNHGVTPLLLAAQNKQATTMKLLVSKGADVDARDTRNGYSSLHYAAEHGLDDVVTEFISRGANLNKTDINGNTPLMVAVTYGRKNMVKYMLSRGHFGLDYAVSNNSDDVIPKVLNKSLDINQRNNHVETPLLVAFKNYRRSLIKLLLDKGADVNLVEQQQGYSCLHYAAEQGMDDIIVDLINKGAVINIKSNDGATPLLLAQKRGQISTIKLLSQCVVTEDKLELPFLYLFAENGDDDAMLNLISQGLDIDSQNANGDTCLHLALKSNKIITAKLLISHGANGNIENNKGCTCLHYAAEAGYDDVIVELLGKGYDINKLSAHGETPLFIALKNKKTDAVKVLLSNKADVNAMDEHEDSCLHKAAEAGLDDVVLYLLNRGADINKRNQNNKTPLHTAILHRKIATARLLLSKGAALDVEHEAISTFFDCLIEKANEEVFSEFLQLVDPQHETLGWCLCRALCCKQIGIARLLLSEEISIVTNDINGNTCLHYAATAGYDAIIINLISRGFDINAQNALGETPLLRSLQCEIVTTAKLFLSKGADADIKNSGNFTCLHGAARAGFDDIVRLLIKKGHDINEVTNYGETPMYLALSQGHISTAKIILSEMKRNSNKKSQFGYPYLHYASQIGGDVIIKQHFDINMRNDRYETPLVLAIEHKQFRIAKVLLSHNAEVTTKDSLNFAGLHYAIEAGEDDIVLDLISHGADVNEQHLFGETPLITAVKNRHLNTVKLLISKGADIGIKDHQGQTCLHHAAEVGAINVLSFLLNKARNVKEEDSNLYGTLLLIALDNNHLNIVKLLLPEVANASAEDEDGRTGLHLAAKLGADKILLDLISRGVDKDWQDRDGDTPLLAALRSKKRSSAKLLLSNCANFHIRNYDETSCMHFAAEAGYDDMVLDFISNGIDVNAKDNNGDTPLLLALKKEKCTTSKLLLDKGANINIKDRLGFFCLHHAAATGYDDILSEAISINNIDQPNNDGNTPILLALINKKSSTAKLLFHHGANINIKNSKGSSCLHYAAEAGYDEVVADFLNKVADINKQNNAGDTPLLLALESKKINTAKLLLSNGACSRISNFNGSSCLHYSARSDSDDLIVNLIQQGLDIDKQDHQGNTPLLLALKNKQIGTAQLLIAKNANVSIRNFSGFSCLHYAAAAGCDVIASELLRRGIDMDKQNNYGNTALIIALSNQRKSTAQLFLSGGANINTSNNNGSSCLHYAARAGYDDVIHELISKNLNLNAQDHDGYTPLLLALEYKRISTAKLLLNSDANVSLRNSKGFSCMHFAAVADDSDILLELVVKYPNINIQNSNGDTPLLFALKNNKTSSARLLLLNGGDVNISNSEQSYCLHYAAAVGDDETLTELTSRGVDINQKNFKGETALFLALKNKKNSTTKLLLSCGADTNITDKYCSSCLHFAATAGDCDVVVQLIDNGFDINQQNDNGDTPLLLALEHKNTAVANLLIFRGADIITGENRKGNSYLHYAASMGDNDIALDFINKGADVNLRNNNGETPLIFALSHKHSSTAKLLLSEGSVIEQDYTYNNSLLHYTAEHGCYELLTELLFENNIEDINIKNNFNETPLHCSIKNQTFCCTSDVQRQIASVKLLLESNANINIQDNDGNTALHCVSMQCSSNIPEESKVLTQGFYRDVTELLLKNEPDVNLKNQMGCTALYLAIECDNKEIAMLIQRKIK